MTVQNLIPLGQSARQADLDYPQADKLLVSVTSALGAGELVTFEVKTSEGGSVPLTDPTLAAPLQLSTDCAAILLEGGFTYVVKITDTSTDIGVDVQARRAF